MAVCGLLAGISTMWTGAWLWRMAGKMRGYQVLFDSRGVEFDLGTKLVPDRLFMAWNAIRTTEKTRMGNAVQFTVTTADGSQIRFSSYTFFRPGKLGRIDI